MTTASVNVIDKHAATGTAYALVLSGKPADGSLSAPVERELLAEYTCSFEKAAEQWKIATQHVNFIFKRRAR
jgi:hypothetical protein